MLLMDFLFVSGEVHSVCLSLYPWVIMIYILQTYFRWISIKIYLTIAFYLTFLSILVQSFFSNENYANANVKFPFLLSIYNIYYQSSIDPKIPYEPSIFT